MSKLIEEIEEDELDYEEKMLEAVQLTKLLRKRDILLSRQSLIHFIMQLRSDYIVNFHHFLICERLSTIFEKPGQRIVITVPPQYGKPVWEEELVIMESGRRIPLKNVEIGDCVIDKDGLPREVTAVHEQGLLNTLKMTTHSGRNVFAAPDHPFLTTDGWRKASELEVHDYLVIRSNLQTDSTPRDWREFRLLGYLVGDGCVVRANRKYDGESFQCTITQSEEVVFEDIIKIAEFKEWTYTYDHKPNSKAKTIHLNSGAKKWVKQHSGIAGQDSGTKKIPDWIFEGSEIEIAHFIAGYWITDGTISPKGTTRKGGIRRDATIELYSIQRQLLCDVQSLLSRLGINSRVRSKPITGRDYLSYRLTIRDSHNMAIFKDKIPLIGSKKQKIDEIVMVKKERFDDGYIYDEIISIEEGGELPCRCITVKDGKSFLANDFIVHNSEIVSRYFPAWCLGKMPEGKIILASYSASLSEGFNRDAQKIMESPEFREIFPKSMISPYAPGVKRTQDFVETTSGGYLFSVGVGGATTGRTANPLFIVDDPFKDVAEAMSAQHRRNVQDWYSAVVQTRLSLNATVIIMHTRWHEDDLAGWLLDKAADDPVATQWDILNFPAVADNLKDLHPADPRELGEALWPDFKGDADVMKRIEKDVGAMLWYAIYQQKPKVEGGNMVSATWWRYYKFLDIDQLEEVILSVDCAFKDLKTSDFVAIQVWGRQGTNKYLIHQILGQFDIIKTIEMMIIAIQKYPRIRAKLVEDKANGPAVLQLLNGKMSGLIAVEPFGSKISRVVSISPQIQSGNVWLPHPDTAGFDIISFINEWSAFPRGKHDDQVDAATQAIERLSRGENNYLRRLLRRD